MGLAYSSTRMKCRSAKAAYKVKVPNGWAVTGYDGTMLLDPEANDLVKLVVRTNELPSASLACRATSEVTYRRTPIHQRMVLVPHETKLYTISTTGNESIANQLRKLPRVQQHHKDGVWE